MAIPVARVHLAMAHAALPGLLPSPPKRMMLPLLPAPPCTAIILPCSPPSRPSRADAVERWDAHKIKIKQGGGSPASPPPPSAGQCSLNSISGPGGTSLSEKWVSKKKSAGAGAATSSSSSSSSSSSNGRADSEERWDAHKRPASPAASSSSATSSNRTKTRQISRRPNGGRALSPSSADRWDANKKPRAPPAAAELDDGESSTGSNDMELVVDKAARRAFYAGPGFIRSPEPSMLPKPSFLRIRVA
uniref:Uncharacterized protein n=1 Tax=Setaria viridis TaxID=4556 RepID=A0A4U6TBD4_SETVI|nr:hypothetical protein SEVIR_8G035000v2 [Setaria viridis]